MLFNSIEFLLFLPVVFLLYWLAFKSLRSRNWLLLAASYVFYGWWDYRFLLLIFGITAVSYAGALVMLRYDGSRSVRRWTVAVVAVLCLGTLGVFKYFNFFAGGFARLLRLAGMEADPVSLDLILPVGISFYTFQALSYVIDVYRRKMEAVRKPLPFFVFISVFPQLVAGPIERATNLIPQFMENRRFSYRCGVDGMRLILWGLFKKMVVADNAATVVNLVFADYQGVGTLNLWIGALLFSFQIYGDFSGYSDIAIGTARLFGVKLMRNFHFPYFSRDIAEFWRRWHISLNTWFVDYLYIPLGGSRRGKWRTVRNTMVVFLTSGLWHGANLTFVAWGAWHAMLFVPLLLTGRNKRYLPSSAAGPVSFKESLMMGLTFILVVIGWVIFRADNLHQAADYIRLMFSHYTPAAAVLGKSALLWSVLMLAAEWLSRDREAPTFLAPKGMLRYRAVRWTVYLVLFLVTLIFAGSQAEFIYFKF